MKILVVGCLHGNWELLVNKIQEIESQGKKIDLIIVSGDAETMRKKADLKSLSTEPGKCKLMGTFSKVFKGELQIPIPTFVLGGNHEAMDWLHQLPFGGWLAPNVFYTGRASSFVFGDRTFSFISGIYRPNYYYCPVNEIIPIRNADAHASYCIRSFSDFQILGLPNTDYMGTHDWPAGSVLKYGGHYIEKNCPGFIEADKNGGFGLLKGMEINQTLRPSIWYAAHHHFYFTAQMDQCSFKALNEAPKKKWCKLVDFEGNPGEMLYRGDWISILKVTGAEMADPGLLKDINWQEKWNQLKPTLEAIPNQPLGEFELDPVKYTANFCKRYGIYCPNKEIQPFI